MIDTELYSIPLAADRYLVYAPLRRAAFVANTRMVNEISVLRDGAAEPEQSSSATHLLSELEIINGGPEPFPITEFRGQPKPTNITLFLTTACNLRCSYCYASAGDTPAKRMPFEVAKRGIEFVVENAISEGSPLVELNFHGGGEPTVNWETLTSSQNYASELCQRHGLELVSSLATNGVIARSRLEWIVNNLDGISLSFDGLPEAHDRHRKTIAGTGSSGAVINTLRCLDQQVFPYGIRITVTRDQIPLLSRSVSFVCENFSPQAIQVEPSYQLGRWKDAPSAETTEFIEAYRAAQAQAFSHGKQISFSGARLGTLSNHFCGVTQDSFSLSASGSVSACYEVFDETSDNADTFIYGQPRTDTAGYQFDLAKLDGLRRQAVQFRDYCSGCFAKWSCGGDCYNKSIAATGTKEFVGSDRCHIIRELTKDQILQAIADSGGLYWKGRDDEPADDDYLNQCECEDLEAAE
jgi:uncharacterized protein